MKHLLKKRDERGIAMMMTLVTMLVLTILAAELVYESSVYSGVVFRQRDQLRARLLARSGLRLALLQTRLIEKAKAQLKNIGGGLSEDLVDQLWETPMVLPPPVPPGLGLIETQALQSFTKALGLDGRVSISISGENDRFSINQLVWISDAQKSQGATNPTGGSARGGTVVGGATTLTDESQKEILEKTRKNIADFLDRVIEKRRQDDEAFRDQYYSLTGETIVRNLVAFMDPNTRVDADNREKKDYYQRFEPTPYSLKDAPLVSDTEYSMVKGFDATIAKMMSDNFTTQITTGLDINNVSLNTLQALIPELGAAEIEAFDKRRQDTTLGRFKKEEEFWQFLETLGSFGDAKKRLAEAGVKLLEKNTSFRVAITATSGMATKTWIALIGPMPPSQEQKPNEQGAPPVDISAAAPPTSENPDEKNEQKNNQSKNDSNSLNIIYLKAD